MRQLPWGMEWIRTAVTRAGARGRRSAREIWTDPAVRVGAVGALILLAWVPMQTARADVEPYNDAPQGRNRQPVAEAATTPFHPPILYIQPFGSDLRASDLAYVRDALLGFFDMEVRVLAPVPHPRSAWYAPRSRYRAEKLLVHLDTLLPADGYRILGVSGSDISTTRGQHYDWGMMGLASYSRPVGVISAWRCGLKAHSSDHARVRVAKVAVHEIGHTLGLEHCPTRGCLMEDAHGTTAASDRGYDFCMRCRAQLGARGAALFTQATIPWGRPIGEERLAVGGE